MSAKNTGSAGVSHIITFGTLGAKSVIRDIGRVLGWSYGDADRLAKMIPAELGITLAGARRKNADLKKAIDTEPATAPVMGDCCQIGGIDTGCRDSCGGCCDW